MARSRRIMVGYDGSDGARRALDAAADLVGYGSTLTVVTVQTSEVGLSVASDARDRLRHRHIEAHYQEPTGELVDRLLTAAGELDADLVVVRRSKSSARVVRSAACDVLVVR